MKISTNIFFASICWSVLVFLSFTLAYGLHKGINYSHDSWIIISGGMSIFTYGAVYNTIAAICKSLSEKPK